MKSAFLLSLLLGLLTFNLSCAEQKSTEKNKAKTEPVSSSVAVDLAYTSGIRAIFQDREGGYWIGSHEQGLAYYDGNSLKYFTSHDGLPDNQIRAIQEDKNGTLWISTANGICSFDGKSFTPYPTDTNAPPADWETTEGELWFYAGEEDGIYRFDGKNLHYLVFPKAEHAEYDKAYGVTGLSKDKGNTLWIATYTTLFRYDGELVDVFKDRFPDFKNQDELHIRSVLADSKGRIWIGNNGIGVILISGDSLVQFSKAQGKLLPIKTFWANYESGASAKNTGLQSVFAIEEDREGNIWFTDRDSGVWRYDGKRLKNDQVNPKNPTLMAWSIYQDRAGNLLFGMADGDVYRFNGKGFDKWL